MTSDEGIIIEYGLNQCIIFLMFGGKLKFDSKFDRINL